MISLSFYKKKIENLNSRTMVDVRIFDWLYMLCNWCKFKRHLQLCDYTRNILN